MATFLRGGKKPIRIECGVQYTPLFGLRWMPRHCGGKQVGVGAQDMYVNYNVDRKEKRLLTLWWCPCFLDILRCGFWWRVWRAEFLWQTREKGLSPDLTPYTGSRHPRGTPLDHQESRRNLFLEGGDNSEGGKQRRLILVGAADYNVSRLRSSCWHKQRTNWKISYMYYHEVYSHGCLTAGRSKEKKKDQRHEEIINFLELSK